MDLRTECCAKCGIDLYDEVNGSKKIFRSFATKLIDGVELHFCIDCYNKLNNKFNEENVDD